jgi:hypothetical protein
MFEVKDQWLTRSQISGSFSVDHHKECQNGLKIAPSGPSFQHPVLLHDMKLTYC